MKHFSSEIVNWYPSHKRDLPWRRGSNPYYVVVSEIMLQQTQASRVAEKFSPFIARFPTINALAKATKEEVIQAWSGMGYNRRALLLHKFAQEIVSKCGKIPDDSKELLQLPGIGPYTAGAIAAFAFNKPEPAIDVNIRRICMRFFRGKDQGLPMGKQEELALYNLIKKSIPKGKSSELHNALMDFGSLVCTRDAPKCNECPLHGSCSFFPLYKEEKEKALFVMGKKLI